MGFKVICEVEIKHSIRIMRFGFDRHGQIHTYLEPRLCEELIQKHHPVDLRRYSFLATYLALYTYTPRYLLGKRHSDPACQIETISKLQVHNTYLKTGGSMIAEDEQMLSLSSKNHTKFHSFV